MPIGITALTLLLSQWLVFSQQMFFHGKSFIVTWYAFFIVCAGAFLIKWFFIAFMQGSGFSGDGNILVSYLMTIVLYPLISWLFSRIQIVLAGDT
jgi:rod shape-determining protein MreD